MRTFPRKSFQDFANEFDVGITTIRKVANENQLHRRVARRKPYLSKPTIGKRLLWAKENKHTNWKRVIFTDESSLEIGRDLGRKYVTRKAGEEFLPNMLDLTFRSNRQTLMVWGAIANNHKWPLLRIPLKPSKSDGKTRVKAEGLNAQKYTDAILSGPLLEAVNDMKAENALDVLVVENGAPAHKSVIAKKFRLENHIPSLTHPPSSPDLNLIENVWQVLKQRISTIHPKATTLDGLWDHAQQAWAEIPVTMINQLVDGMEGRVQDVLKAKGHSTKY